MTNNRPSLRALVENWRASPLPLPARLRLAFENNLRKLRRRRSCCGNPGEPGC